MRRIRVIQYVGCAAILALGMFGCHDSGDDGISVTLPGMDLMQAVSDSGGDGVQIALEVPEDVDDLTENFGILPEDFEAFSTEPDSVPTSENSERIVGGKPASIRKWPSITALAVYKNDGTYLCGGTLIHKQWVLTAAHCVEGAWKAKVFLGTSNLTRPKEIIYASKAVWHNRYNFPNNDIALLKLYNASKRRVASYNAPASLNGKKAQVAGWGKMIARPPSKPISASGPSSKILREVTVPIVSNAVCNKAYRGGITNNMLCAGYKWGKKGTCQGDSGGPLMVNGKVAGIVSFGAGCAWKGYYGGYTRVSRYRNWIKNVIAKY